MTKLSFVSVISLQVHPNKSEFTTHVCGSDFTHSANYGKRLISTAPQRTLRKQILSAADNGKRKPKKGLFGRLKDSILRPIVTVPGGGKGGDLMECVFCKGSGYNDCDACKGSGKDSLGTCLMCGGKTYLECTVCRGVGTVDRIRRGGTDDSNQYVSKGQKKKS